MKKIKSIPGTPKIKRNSIRPRIQYLSARNTYKMFIPKLPVFITEVKPEIKKVYYFNSPEDLPVQITRTWFIGKKTLALTKRYPNTYMVLKTLAETFPESTKDLVTKMQNTASLKSKYHFTKQAAVWLYFRFSFG